MKRYLFLAFGFMYWSLLSQSQFIAWPEMLVWPFLHAHGLEYYQDIITIYPPLLLQVLAIIFISC